MLAVLGKKPWRNNSIKIGVGKVHSSMINNLTKLLKITHRLLLLDNQAVMIAKTKPVIVPSNK